MMVREEWYKDHEKEEEGSIYGGRGGKTKPFQKDGKIQTSTVKFIPYCSVFNIFQNHTIK